MAKKELFQEFAEYHIPDIRIDVDEWRAKYANTYNILALSEKEENLIFAAEDIIKIYLLQEAKRREAHANPA